MTSAEVALVAHRSCPKQSTLLVDLNRDLAIAFAQEESVIALAKTGKKPDEMWALAGAGTMHLVVLCQSRPARELYRVLALAERLVAPGGAILILPYAADTAGETRIEATEIFCGVFPEWERKLLDENVVELRKVLGEPAGGANTEQPTATSSSGLSPLSSAALKRVVSLSLFGDGDYWKFLPTYVRAHHTLFPGFELRIHHDDAIYRMPYGDTLHGLQRRGLVKLVHMAPDGIAIGKCKAMLWRLAPLWDPEVEYVFCRDVDSLPTWRERRAVEQFMEKGFYAGVIHDNVQHARMMGGLCQFKTKPNLLFEKYESLGALLSDPMFSTFDWDAHGTDQDTLNAIVSGSLVTVLEQSLFTSPTEGGAREYRKEPTMANGVIENLGQMPTSCDDTDDLINYIGAAGFDIDRARAFYDKHCPVIDEITAAEKFSK